MTPGTLCMIACYAHVQAGLLLAATHCMLQCFETLHRPNTHMSDVCPEAIPTQAKYCTMYRPAIVRNASRRHEMMQWDETSSGCYLELTSSAEPHVILAWQLLHPIARLVHGDATHIAAHQLVLVIVHIAVTHCASVTCPPHLHTAITSHQASQLRTCCMLLILLPTHCACHSVLPLPQAELEQN